MKLDRQLTYRHHLEALRAKVSTLRPGALALAYSSAEYAAQAWCRSTHTKKLAGALNDTMRLITGCLRPTPTDLLPVLAGIAPPRLRREHLTDKLTTKSLADDDHLLHNITTNSLDLGRQRLRSRRPFSRHAAALNRAEFSLIQEWEKSWEKTPRPPKLLLALIYIGVSG